MVTYKSIQRQQQQQWLQQRRPVPGRVSEQMWGITDIPPGKRRSQRGKEFRGGFIDFDQHYVPFYYSGNVGRTRALKPLQFYLGQCLYKSNATNFDNDFGSTAQIDQP